MAEFWFSMEKEHILVILNSVSSYFLHHLFDVYLKHFTKNNLNLYKEFFYWHSLEYWKWCKIIIKKKSTILIKWLYKFNFIVHSQIVIDQVMSAIAIRVRVHHCYPGKRYSHWASCFLKKRKGTNYEYILFTTKIILRIVSN